MVGQGKLEMRLFVEPTFLTVGAAVGAFGVLAGVPLVMVVLLGMMAIDIAVGLALAWSRQEISARRSFEGGIRKVIIIGVVLAAWLVQYMLAVAAYTHLAAYLPSVPNIPFAEVVASYFILYEFISILENAVRAGIRLPSQLSNMLKVDATKRKEEAGQ